MKFISIRSRLIFWIGLMVTLILSVGSYVIFVTARSNLYQEIDQNLQSTLTLQGLELEVVDGVIYHEWLHDLENDDARVRMTYIQVWNEVTGESTRSPALQSTDLPHFFGAETARYSNILLPNGHHGRVIGRQVFPVVEWTEQAAGVGRVEHLDTPPHYMTIALDVELAENALRRLAGTLLLGLVFSLLVSFITIRLIIAFSFRPLERLERVIVKSDVNDPQATLEVPQDLPSEVRGLVSRYQGLFARISRVRERERKFSANVAHELRTPLAGIEATLEQAIAVDREAADYRSRIADTLKIATRMHELVNRLMWFSRLYNSTEEAVIAEVDVHMLIEARHSILAEQISARGLQIQLSLLAESSLLESDETLVSILMNNLIGNAVAHADLNSVVKLSTCDGQDGFHFELINDAEDFNEAELPRIFEPFYRSDRARTADVSHSGLGLSLASEITQLLEIQLDVRFEQPRSFIVEIVFPGNRDYS